MESRPLSVVIIVLTNIFLILRDQHVVESVLNEIVQSVMLLGESSEKSIIARTDSSVETQNKIPSLVPNDGINSHSTDPIIAKTVVENLEYISKELKNPKEIENKETIKFSVDSKKDDLEAINQKFEYSGRASDPTEVIEPYSSDSSDTEKNCNKTGHRKKECGFRKTKINKENNPYTVANNEPSVIVINKYSDERGSSSDSDFNNVKKSDSSVIERSKKIYKQKKSRESPSTSASNAPSLKIKINNNSSDEDDALSHFADFGDKETSICKMYDDDELSDQNTSLKSYSAEPNVTMKKLHEKKYSEEKVYITKLTRSPRIYGRKQTQIHEDIHVPSTSINIVPSIIVINDFSNESSTSTHSTGEMQRRTERDFAFLSDSDLSDIEANENTLDFGYQNRAYEPSDEIEIGNQESELTQTETNALVSELRSISFDNSYVWSTTGLLKVTQVICCMTMYISIGLCRFYSKYIQLFCILGAFISGFLLIVYSYRIQIVHWKSYKIRLLLSEFLYLVIYTACDTVFAIIKFEFNEESNYRERMATMILMTSTGIAASAYCYDAITCYTFMKEAEKDNPEEKRLIVSYLPTCSESSRVEICDIFHTCIL